MIIKITVLKTNLKTNERVFNDFIFNDDDWNQEDIELLSVNSKRMLTMNEYANAWLFLSQGFGEQLQLSENLDLEDFEEIFPFYTSTDSKKRKRGYIFQMKEMDGIQTRIILVAPKHYLSAQL
tara:strand:- start:28 stop:396 length:369 start_codon:yes stop_codon:yes gene_type:complete